MSVLEEHLFPLLIDEDDAKRRGYTEALRLLGHGALAKDAVAQRELIERGHPDLRGPSVRHYAAGRWGFEAGFEAAVVQTA